MQDAFRKFAVFVSRLVGSVWAFLVVITAVLVSGFYYHFSDIWKMNVSFIGAVVSLSVLIFLQRSQNHNDKATHVKLDELINAIGDARNEVAKVEDLPEKEIDRLKETNPAET
jgi:low affinity Fe/Cu permease